MQHKHKRHHARVRGDAFFRRVRARSNDNNVRVPLVSNPIVWVNIFFFFGFL